MLLYLTALFVLFFTVLAVCVLRATTKKDRQLFLKKKSA